MYAQRLGATITSVGERNTMFVRFDPCRDFEPLCQPFGRRGWGVVRPFDIPMDAYLEDKNVVVNRSAAKPDGRTSRHARLERAAPQ